MDLLDFAAGRLADPFRDEAFVFVARAEPLFLPFWGTVGR